VSVFAGRIADTGRDPAPVLTEAVARLRAHANVGVIWASPREVLNVFQADRAGCHAIALTYDLVAKLRNVGRDLDQLSLETVRMFHDDAVAGGLQLEHRSGTP
jgi:transaldolase